MSLWSIGRASKTMCWPSGDQRGESLCPWLKRVNWAAFPPSASQVQISMLPERSDAKAMRLPSGE